jgi:hypothetical protein
MQTTQQQPFSEKKSRKIPRLEKAQRHLFKRSDYFIDGNTGFQSGAQSRSGLQLALWSWMSALIDGLILISISCFSLILFSFLMKTQARELFRAVAIEPSIAAMFLVSFLFSFWVYMVMMRVFMGASLGEWSCQLRLGQPVQRIRAGYVLRVIARTTLLLVTGVVVLPVLSLIFKRDLPGDITGVRIYSLT